MDQLPALLDRYGLPTVINLLVLYWIARKIFEPLVLAHAAYLADTTAAYTSLATAYTAMATAADRQTAILARLTCPAPIHCSPDAPNAPIPEPLHER